MSKKYEEKTSEELIEEEEEISLKDAIKQKIKRHPFLTGIAIVLSGGTVIAAGAGIVLTAKILKEKLSSYDEDDDEDDDEDYEDKTTEDV